MRSSARPCSASATSCSTNSSMARCRGFRRKRRRRSSRSSAARPMSAAPATSRATSPRSARAASSSGLVGEDEAGAKLKAAAGAGKPDRGRAGRAIPRGRRRARCASSPSISPRTCCAPTGNWPRRRPADIEQKLIDAILPQLAARRHRAAVRLCQGRADGARDPQRHRRRAEARQARDRRSQERQFCDLSRRDAADAQPQGIRRSDPQPRRHRHRALRTPRRTRCSSPTARPCW